MFLLRRCLPPNYRVMVRLLTLASLIVVVFTRIISPALVHNLVNSMLPPAVAASVSATVERFLPNVPVALAQSSIPNASEIAKYLVVAMGDDADMGRAFQMSNSEIGADRNVLSPGEPIGFGI